MFRSTLKWLGIALAALLLVVFVGGGTYQWVATNNDLTRYPPPGELIDVKGRMMHIHCQGTGTPTVVVEQGLTSLSLAWQEIHHRVAELTRVCSYDRAGMGYSEPIGHPTRAPEVAERLHLLLQGAGISDDLVMVGWSAGGVYIREFFRAYPDQVKAMVFVDSSHEQQGARLPELEQSGDSGFLRLARYLAPVGLLRISGFVRRQVDNVPVGDELREQLLALYHQSHAVGTLLNASIAFEQDTNSPNPPDSLGDLPLIVLSQGKPVELSDEVPPNFTLEDLLELREVWNQLQIELASLSSRGSRIVAADSGHAIHFDQPDLLVDAVDELVQVVRQENAAPDPLEQ